MFGLNEKKIIDEYIQGFSRFQIFLETLKPTHALEYSGNNGEILISLLEKGIIKSCLKIVDDLPTLEWAQGRFAKYIENGRIQLCLLADLPDYSSLNLKIESFFSFFQFNSMESLNDFYIRLSRKNYKKLAHFILFWGNRIYPKYLLDHLTDSISTYIIEEKLQMLNKEVKGILAEDIKHFIENKSNYFFTEIYQQRTIKSFKDLWIYLQYIHVFWKKYVASHSENVIKADVQNAFENYIKKNGFMDFASHVYSISFEDEV
jgi:hypothetical protein